MLEIFKIEGSNLKPIDKILIIEPFKTIWLRDKSKHKEGAIKDFTYIEFMVSPLEHNPYKDLKEEERSEKIKIEILRDFKYIPDSYIIEAIDLYRSWVFDNSFSYRFLQAAITGAEQLIEFFQTVDLSERANSGMPIYKPSDITRALKDTEDTIRNLQNLEKRVFEEIKKKSIRGNKDINPLEI